jgi:CxxC-x17-CxxC domain-containing protein
VAYTDKTLVCQDCGAEFTFSGGDQEFYAEKGYSEPKRCPDCRRARKAQGGGGGGGGGGSYGPRQMFQVTCSNCGQTAEVPFQPRGDRPVYCNDCFAASRSGGGGRR